MINAVPQWRCPSQMTLDYIKLKIKGNLIGWGGEYILPILSYSLLPGSHEKHASATMIFCLF